MSRDADTTVILGGGGMLASALERVLRDSTLPFYSFTETQLDITDKISLRSELSRVSPSIIINTAAYTDVDGCEENADLAYAVNGNGAGNVAVVSEDLGARLIHISTDYVFDGQKQNAYFPSDKTNPQSVYGKSKLAGEKTVKSFCQNHLIIRTSWLFGPWGKNFVHTMFSLAETGKEIRVVNDQRGCPTYTMDLAKALLKLANSDLRGTHHLTNTGDCSWYEFAASIFQTAEKTVNLIPVSTEEFPRRAPRPKNSVLDCSSTTATLANPLPKWQEAVGRYLKEYLL